MTSKTEWWEESAVFHLPGVESRDIPELVKPCAVLIHGIDGKTNPQLLDTDELLQVVDQDLKLTFSYDRTRVVGETASEETILQVAADLLEFLRENAGCVKGGDVDPPSFMFFAYDLGGSIIKQALVQASLNDQYRWIFDQTSLVIFYGTPHRSANSQAWALRALRLLHLAFNGLLDLWICDYVERMSQYHEKLNDSFRELAPHFRILNVCQRSDSPSYDVIVDAPCATVGLETEMHVSLERSHYQLSILLGYQQRRWMRETLLNENIRRWSFYQKFLAVLQINQRKHCYLLKEDTPSLTDAMLAFFSDESAKKWRNMSDVDIIRLISPQNMRFHAFFKAFSSHIQTTSEGEMDIFLRLECGDAHGSTATHQQIYISMCLQLLEQRPSLILWIQHLYPNLRDATLGLDDRWKIRVLSRCLRTLLLAPKPGITYCLVEYAPEVPQREVVSQILASTQQSEIPFRLLISTPSGVMTGLDVVDGSPCVDLFNNPSTATAARTCLQSARKGRSFELWAKMLGDTEHCDNPNFDKSAGNSENGLISLSTSNQLSIALEQILSRCVRNGMSWMLRALAFVCFANRPLSRLEMEQVLEIVCSQESSLQVEDRIGETLLQALDLALPSLLTITEDAVWGRSELRQILASLWTSHSGCQDDPELYIARTCFCVIANHFQSGPSMEDDCSEPVDRSVDDAEFTAKSSSCEALNQYAARYWMEHHFRGSRDASHFSEAFQGTLISNPRFNQDAWIRYLASLHWSYGLEWLTDKILPESIRNFMETDSAAASYVSFRMATLPLTAGDDFDWLLLQVIRKHLSEEASFEIVFKKKALFDTCRKPSTLQKFVAATSDSFRVRFVAEYDNGDFFHESFVDILLTAIAIGNVSTAVWLLGMITSIGRKNENAVETTLGTALQVASEYGDEHVVERILGLNINLAPLSLEKEFLWNALHAACHQGQSSIASRLIDKIGNEQESGSSCICSTSPGCPLLITSARGLFILSKTLAPLHSRAHANEELSKSAIGLVTTHGFLKTLESLLDDNHFKIALKGASKHPLFLALESGNHEMARAVYGKYLDAVYDEYENQNRSREEEDDSSESSESDDAEDNVLLDAEKIIEKALFTAIDCNMAHFSARHIMENLRNPSVATDSQGRTPLIVSATIGSVEFAKQLKLGDDETGDGHMRKALCLASKYGHQDFVNYLLSQKSPSLPPHETSNIWTEDNEPSTPVTNAAAGGHHRIAERLVDLTSTEDLKTEFLHAAKYGLDRAMKLILSVATLRDSKIREDCINAMDENSNTALQHAIKGEHARVVHFMILQGASLEMADDSKMTPLAIASEISSLDSMKLLLDAGASTETLIKGGRSVLMQTIWWENEQAVDLLLRYNAKACITGYWSYGASSLLEFTLEWSTDNVLRVLLRHFDKIRKMTSPESIPEDIPTPTEALRTVIKHGRASSVDVLFEIWRKFDDTIHEDDFEIGSVFMYAARFGTMDMLQRIWEHLQASIDVNEIRGFHGSALQAATSSEVDTLLKFNAMIDWGANLVPEISGTIAAPTSIPSGSSRVSNYESLHGYMGTPLHVAAFSAKRDLIDAILRRKNDLKDWPDLMGRLPLHFAAEKGDLETVNQLSSESSPIHAEDIQQRNVLHIACAVGNISFVNEFVEKDFANSFINKPDVDGWTPLHWACRSGNEDLVETLIAMGADISKAAIRPAGWLPCHVAVFHGWSPESLHEPEIRGGVGEEMDGTSSIADTDAYTEYSSSRMAETDERPTEAGEVSNSNCDCCHCAIFGRRHQCASTEAICARFDLCFKCVGHAGDIHFMDHEFVDRDPY